MGDQSLAWAGGRIQGGCSKIALSCVREPGQPASMWAQAPLGKPGDSGGSTPGNLESTPSVVDSARPAGDGSLPGAAFSWGLTGCFFLHGEVCPWGQWPR